MASSYSTIRTLRGFSTHQSGSTAIVFSLSAAVLLAAGGMAVDYARGTMELTSIQANLDAAVLAGVSGTLVPEKQIATAQNYFAQYKKGAGTQYDVNFEIKKGVLTGTINARVQTSLLRVLDINHLDLKSTSSATSEAALEPLCFMAMHPTRKHTLELKGSVSVYAPDCNIYGNSDHEFDVVDPHTPQNFLTAKFVAAIGGGHHFLENVKPAVEFGTTLVEDPLKGLSIPSPGACTQTGYEISGKSMTLPPGHYCKGLSIKKGSKVQLQSEGTYFISGGSFAIDSSSLNGEGVTIFLTDDDADVEWSKASVRISAKKTGDFAGIVVFGERVPTDNFFEESTVDTHGAFYMPQGAFEWDNSGEPEIKAKWQAFIIDGVSWVGSGVIRYNFDLKGSDIPYPEDLIAMPRPSQARLIN